MEPLHPSSRHPVSEVYYELVYIERLEDMAHA
jgi:hypothetical protein